MPTFAEARAFLLDHRTDYEAAVAGFRWPDPQPYNWALDWFDGILATDADSRDRPALWIVDGATGEETIRSFGELSRRSNQVANYLRRHGLRRGDHLLLLMGNDLPLWETMLAAMKLGAVIIPATTLLSGEELEDRVVRGRARFVVTGAAQTGKFVDLSQHDLTRIAVSDAPVDGWHLYSETERESEQFMPDGATGWDDPMLLYFTSGTTAKPKLVRHSQRSYPIGALTTMYWVGLQPGDVHLNISSPGWAKHAWSSMFAPWNAGATVFVLNMARFDARLLLSTLARCPVTTLCAPPTVWRLLIQERLSDYRVSLREVVGAGEPLNPEVINQVEEAWGLTIRDGYGQTETTALVANSPGQAVKVGAMGRPMPGYTIRVLDADGQETREGEVCLDLSAERPAGLMQGYAAEDGQLTGIELGLYRTGDVAFLDDDGYLTFVGRADDVFKSSDYRISPFELESILIEHPAVAEAAIVPSPDPLRLSIPKAYVQLAPGTDPSAATALAIFRYTRERLSPFKRIRAIEFVTELPKTISGKIRRVQLRRREVEGPGVAAGSNAAFVEADFPELSERSA